MKFKMPKFTIEQTIVLLLVLILIALFNIENDLSAVKKLMFEVITTDRAAGQE